MALEPSILAFMYHNCLYKYHNQFKFKYLIKKWNTLCNFNNFLHCMNNILEFSPIWKEKRDQITFELRQASYFLQMDLQLWHKMTKILDFYSTIIRIKSIYTVYIHCIRKLTVKIFVKVRISMYFNSEFQCILTANFNVF